MTKLLTGPLSQLRVPRFRQRFGHRATVPQSTTKILLSVMSMPLLIFLTIPLVVLVLRVSPLELVDHLGSDTIRSAVILSALTSLFVMLLAVVAGTPLAYVLARYPFSGRKVVDTLIDLPMVLPPSVAGIALLLTFGRRGLVGQHLSVFGIELAFTTAAVVLAQTFVAAPLYVKSARTAFAVIEREIELAAGLDGAAPPQVFRFITLPLAWAALFAGAVMTWARALGEFGATILFAGNFPGRTQTIPLATYLAFEGDLGVAITLSTILLLFAYGVLLTVKALLQHQADEQSG
jgi:molybdate transport system permease protein